MKDSRPLPYTYSALLLFLGAVSLVCTVIAPRSTLLYLGIASIVAGAAVLFVAHRQRLRPPSA